jgi:hypothetical protein
MSFSKGQPRKDFVAEPASWAIDPLTQSLVALCVHQHAVIDPKTGKFRSRKHWTKASRELRMRFHICIHPQVRAFVFELPSDFPFAISSGAQELRGALGSCDTQ